MTPRQAGGLLVSGNDLFNGAMHHLALTWDSVTGEVEVYVDGTSIGTQTFATGSVATGGVFTLGQRIEDVGTADYQTAGEIFEGTIYEFRVYDDVRLQEQIRVDMVTPLDENNLPSDLINGYEFLITGGSPSGDDITGNDDLTINLSA
ncbi:MAG: hypothetical protein IID44_23015 [Planctomycetes bacterium]|nr:hypothetical protein [Planctomycetota bacterium]